MLKQLHFDQTTKIFLVVFVVAVSYFVISIAITPFFIKAPQTMYEAMKQMMGISQPTNIVALIVSLGLGLFVSYQLKTKNMSVHNPADIRKKALAVVRKKLSDDEKQMLREIEKAESITQDSLRARLGWSKAKISTIITRLDKMNLIQREKQGKTYKVFLTKDLR